MDGYTKFTKVIVDELKIAGGNVGPCSTADASKAAGAAPTKAEFDAVATLANDLKATLNAFIEWLQIS